MPAAPQKRCGLACAQGLGATAMPLCGSTVRGGAWERFSRGMGRAVLAG